jgi:hypothetical protein
MKRLERAILSASIGAVAPVAGMLAGWWGTFEVLPERGVALAAAGGLAAGLFLDAFFLRRAVGRAHSSPLWMWAALYLFYAVGLFGFFMGVPVFIVPLGIPAGIAFAGRLVTAGAPRAAVLREAGRAASFTTAVLAVACSASAVLALRDPYTAGNLEGMLRLSFQVTRPMILALILIGGAGLLLAQWILTWAAVRWTHARLSTAR